VILIVKSHLGLSRLGAFPIAAALVTLLVGCGQRGPLYLPSKPDAVKASPQPAPTGAKVPTDSQIPASN
jgi:predicted small lipoprotein YifL